MDINATVRVIKYDKMLRYEQQRSKVNKTDKAIAQMIAIKLSNVETKLIMQIKMTQPFTSQICFAKMIFI